MIRVKTIEDFITFVNIAKNKGVEYQLLFSENTAFYGVASLNEQTKHNHFVFVYVLLCPIFTVYISENVILSEKDIIQKATAPLASLKFKKIKILNGEIECSN
ncbi:MAG: hypothetical protein RR463_09515 [Hydrogenoanaerobacterium sp.]